MTKGKWLEEYCHICGRQLNTWDKKVAKVLAYKRHICEACIANEYDMDVESLRSRMELYFNMRPCQGL